MQKRKRKWICIIIAMFVLSGCSSAQVKVSDTSIVENKTIESKILGKTMSLISNMTHYWVRS